VSRFARFVVRRPLGVLLAAALLTGGALYALTHVSFDNSTERLLVRDSESWRFLTSTREAFGGDETLFVLLHAPDVLAPEAIRRLEALTEAVSRVPGVDRTLSLTNLRWPWPVNDDVAVEHLFTSDGEPTPGAPLAAALDHPLVRANLLSPDHRLAAVLALVSPHPEDPHFKGRLIAAVEAAVARAAPGADVTLGGAPFAQVALNELTARDLRVLGPSALAVMAVILFLTYGTAYGVWLPLVTVIVSLLWTVALGALLGRSFSIVTSVLPPLMLAIGTSYTIRVLSEYDRHRAHEADPAAALVATLSAVGMTVVLCGATTALGFASLLSSRVEVIRDLGLLATCGSGFTTLAALTIVPAVLALLRTRRASRQSGVLARGLAQALPRVHALTVRRGGLLLLTAAAIMAVGGGGLRFLSVDQDPYDWFPTGSPVARSTAEIDHELGGVVPLAVVLESPDGVYDPRVIAAADAIASYARRQPDVGAVIAPSDYLRLMDSAVNVGHTRGALPSTRELTAQYLLLFDTSDHETLAPVLSEPAGKAQVLIRLAHASSTRQRAFVARLQAALPTLAPAPLAARVTGTGLLRLETNDEFTDGLARHLLLASVAMAVLLGLALRSWRLGTLALVPNLFPILFLYGVLGWLGIPLNAATVTTGAAALGDAVDDTVQYLDRYRRRLRQARDGEEARLQTLTSVGIPMIASDIGLAAGFCVFLLSRFFPVTSLGLLGAAAMLLSLLANLFVLPVLVALTELRLLRRLLVGYVNQP